MSTKPDQFDVAKTISQALDPFDITEKEKILRWVCESLDITPIFGTHPLNQVDSTANDLTGIPPASALGQKAKDIKSFLTEKDPKNDNHFAAAVAYYHRFEAPTGQRKELINKEDLVDATRKADTHRMKRPEQTLVNAYSNGLLDKGSEKGTYKINSVGENLVAMILPTDSGKVNYKSQKKTKKAIPKKKAKKKK